MRRRLLAVARAPRASLLRAAHRLALRRPLPWGAVAEERRLLGLALARRLGDRVLVLGPTPVVHQVLPGLRLDVVGTSPYDPEVNVVTEAADAGALPAVRYDAIVLSDPTAPVRPDRWAAVLPALRPGGLVAVLGSPGDPGPGAVVLRARTRRRALVAVAVHPPGATP